MGYRPSAGHADGFRIQHISVARIVCPIQHAPRINAPSVAYLIRSGHPMLEPPPHIVHIDDGVCCHVPPQGRVLQLLQDCSTHVSQEEGSIGLVLAAALIV